MRSRARLRSAAAVLLALGLAAVEAGAATSPVGLWQIVDDKTGRLESTVRIEERDGVLQGTLATLVEPNDERGRPKVCGRCSGADKDRPLTGFVIIRNFVADGDRYRGQILDPEDGKTYRAELWVEGEDLKVRGYLGIFYRTQTWHRAR